MTPEKLHRSGAVYELDDYQRAPLKRRAGSDAGATLEDTARQIGAALGRTVVTLRNAHEAIQRTGSEAREAAVSRVDEIRERARGVSARASEIAETVKDKTREWCDAAVSGTEQLSRDARSQVKIGYYRTRLRANQWVREYPVQVLLVAGMAGFLVGVGLRIWRSHEQ